MPPDRIRKVYWDSTVFLAYINGEADRAPVIEAVLDECERGQTEIYTSQITTQEVLYAKTAEGIDLSVEALDKISRLLRRAKRIDVHELVSQAAVDLARDCIRDGRATGKNNWRLKPADYTHIATARMLSQTVGLSEIHTFDIDRWERYGPYVQCKIGKPTSGSFAWEVAPNDSAPSSGGGPSAATSAATPP